MSILPQNREQDFANSLVGNDLDESTGPAVLTKEKRDRLAASIISQSQAERINIAALPFYQRALNFDFNTHHHDLLCRLKDKIPQQHSGRRLRNNIQEENSSLAFRLFNMSRPPLHCSNNTAVSLPNTSLSSSPVISASGFVSRVTDNRKDHLLNILNQLKINIGNRLTKNKQQYKLTLFEKVETYIHREENLDIPAILTIISAICDIKRNFWHLVGETGSHYEFAQLKQRSFANEALYKCSLDVDREIDELIGTIRAQPSQNLHSLQFQNTRFNSVA